MNLLAPLLQHKELRRFYVLVAGHEVKVHLEE